MRILALADIHGSRRAMDAAGAFVQDHRPDLIAIAGDITNWGQTGFAREFLESLPVPTLTVPGNMDTGELGAVLSSGKGRNIHLRRELVGGIPFVGLGGWINPPSLGESWGLSAEKAEEVLSGLMSEGCVLLTHVPPLGHLDAVPVPEAFVSEAAGEHIGHPMVLRLVERFRPRLVISGHVHECRGIERTRTTAFVNPGPAKRGFGAVIELGETLEIKLVQQNK
jgi:hypothetical protein